MGSIPQVVVHRERREGPRGTPGSPPRKSMKKRTWRRRRRVRRFLRDVERGVKRVLPRQHRREVRARARAPARLRLTPRPPAPAPVPRRCRGRRPRPRAAELELGLGLGLAVGPVRSRSRSSSRGSSSSSARSPGAVPSAAAAAAGNASPIRPPGSAGTTRGPGTRRRARLYRAREPRGHLGGGQRARHLREVVGVERGHQRVPERRGERDRGRVLRVRGRAVVVPTRKSFFFPPRETELGPVDPASRLGTAFIASAPGRLRYVVCVPRELVGQIRRDGGERASLHLRAPGSREGLPAEQGDERSPRVRATGGGRRVGRGGVRIRIRGAYRGGARTRRRRAGVVPGGVIVDARRMTRSLSTSAAYASASVSARASAASGGNAAVPGSSSSTAARIAARPAARHRSSRSSRARRVANATGAAPTAKRRENAPGSEIAATRATRARHSNAAQTTASGSSSRGPGCTRGSPREPPTGRTAAPVVKPPPPPPPRSRSASRIASKTCSTTPRRASRATPASPPL